MLMGRFSVSVSGDDPPSPSKRPCYSASRADCHGSAPGSHPACCAKMSLDRIDPDKMSHGSERMGDSVWRRPRGLTGIHPSNFLRGSALKSIDLDTPQADSPRCARCDGG